MKRLVALVTAKGRAAIRDGHARALSLLSYLSLEQAKAWQERGRREDPLRLDPIHCSNIPLKGVVKIL